MKNMNNFKEVCAYFGAAYYFSNLLEYEIINSLSFFEMLPNRNKYKNHELWEKYVDQFYEEKFEKTLGALITNLKKYKEKSIGRDKLIIKLEEALKRRNYLAHHFFRDFIENNKKEDEMIEWLEQSRLLFFETDEQLSALMKPIRTKLGISDELIEKLLNQKPKH